MDTLVLIILLLVIVSQCGLIFWLLEKHEDEKKIFLAHIKDLTDKIYFTSQEHFVSSKIADQTKTEETPPETKEERFVPLEDVPIEELANALGGQPEVKPNG